MARPFPKAAGFTWSKAQAGAQRCIVVWIFPAGLPEKCREKYRPAEYDGVLIRMGACILFFERKFSGAFPRTLPASAFGFKQKMAAAAGAHDIREDEKRENQNTLETIGLLCHGMRFAADAPFRFGTGRGYGAGCNAFAGYATDR